VFLVTGSDAAGIAAKASALAKKAAGPNPDAFSLDVICPREDRSTAETLGDLVTSVLSPSFLGGRKTVWLQDFNAFASEGAKTAKTAEAAAFTRLCELIKAGIPEDIVLILSGPGVDKRRKLYKTCTAAGQVVWCAKPDVKDRNWQGGMKALVLEAARGKGFKLPDNVCGYLVDIIGTDTLRIDAELEKLICYCGGVDQSVSLADARQVCQGDGEVVSWTLQDALGKRNLAESLEQIDLLLRSEKNPDGAIIGLVLQLAGRFRQMLQVKIYMQKHGLRSSRQIQDAMSSLSGESKALSLSQGFEFVTFHPYRVFLLAEQAGRFSGPELVDSITWFKDANLACVSSGVASRVILEQLVVKLVGARPAGVPRR
jgi:DNA polymerase III delta subunit